MSLNATPAAVHELSRVVVALLRGVVYQEADAVQWGALLSLQARLRDHVAVMGLELVLSEAEGYAFLRSRPDAQDDAANPPPRLIARRPLSYSVSLILALLRKKMAEFDAGGGEGAGGSRLVLSRDDIVEMVRVFLPEGSNEARLVDQVDVHIGKIVELGYLRRLKPSAGEVPAFEVRRIIKAFVDAQWLSDFDQRLEVYRRQLATSSGAGSDE